MVLEGFLTRFHRIEVYEGLLDDEICQEFRTFPMEHLAGEASTVVRLKEHQCTFECLGNRTISSFHVECGFEPARFGSDS